MQRRAPILLIFGTRPEAIKLAPLARELRARGEPVRLLATGQHPTLANAMLREVGLLPDIDLRIHRAGNTPADLLAIILQRLPPTLAEMRPAMVVVQGDTVSTLGGALAATYGRVPVAHVEAGLRTNDVAEPFPEEHHRLMVANLAALHFAPTDRAAAALRREGVPDRRIQVTGNTGIDALLATQERVRTSPRLRHGFARRFPFLSEPGRPFALATIHRRENVGARLGAISTGLARLVETGAVRLMMPLHPNPQVSGHFRERLGALSGVHLLPAVSHSEMLWLMQHARLLLTDSGGLQEEAPALGLRAIILRELTERPEAVDCGAATLVGSTPDAMVKAAMSALAQPPLARMFPFGDGQAAVRIAGAIAAWLDRPAITPVLQPA